MTQVNPTTTNSGAPVASDAHSLSVGADGPLVLHDHYLVEKLAQFNRFFLLSSIPKFPPYSIFPGILSLVSFFLASFFSSSSFLTPWVPPPPSIPSFPPFSFFPDIRSSLLPVVFNSFLTPFLPSSFLSFL